MSQPDSRFRIGETFSPASDIAQFADAATLSALNAPKPLLWLSFDVETSGESPVSGDMIMLGIAAVRDDATPHAVHRAWVTDSFQFCSTTSHVIDETNRCFQEFWVKHLDILEYIREQAEHPKVGAAKLSQWLSKLAETYTLRWCASPAAYDWQWLNAFYDKWAEPSAYRLPHKAECMSGLKLALEFGGMKPYEINRYIYPTRESTLVYSHNALDDATRQAYVFLRLKQLCKQRAVAQ